MITFEALTLIVLMLFLVLFLGGAATVAILIGSRVGPRTIVREGQHRRQ